jgi:hypothetical protein
MFGFLVGENNLCERRVDPSCCRVPFHPDRLAFMVCLRRISPSHRVCPTVCRTRSVDVEYRDRNRVVALWARSEDVTIVAKIERENGAAD